MSAHDDLEAALAALIVEKTGEAWPVTAWVLIASTTDRETMLLEEPFWAFSQGQHSAMTRGLIEQARDELTADAIASIAYIPLDDDDDD